MADLSPPHLRGASFGLRQSLDTVGALAGPIVAIVAMGLLANDIRAVFWIAVIPALVSVAILVAFVNEPDRRADAGPRRVPLRLADIKTLSAAYWGVVTVGAVLTLARFSEAFLVLRASGSGLAIAFVPLVLVVMNVAYAASAYPAGVWADRAGRRVVLLAGVGILVLADVVLATASTIWLVMAGIALWGIAHGSYSGLAGHYGDGYCAGSPPRHGLRSLQPCLWDLDARGERARWSDRFGPTGTFAAGAIFSLISLVGLAFAGRQPRSESGPR